MGQTTSLMAVRCLPFDPECDFTTPFEPIAEPCPKCGAPFIVEKRTKQGNFRACIRENCDWEVAAPEPAPFVHPQAPTAPEPQPVGAPLKA